MWNILRLKETSRSEISELLAIDGVTATDPGFLAEPSFMRMLYLERKRTERSRSRFVLMLLDSGNLLRTGDKAAAFESLLAALSRSTRETDVKGWYREGSVIGVIFTEIGTAEGRSITSALLAKATNALSSALSIEQVNQVSISFHLFPDEWEQENSSGPADLALYPEQRHSTRPKKLSRIVKRAIDIAVSLLTLIVLFPLLLAIALAVKLTSKGPILFRQQRLGQHGRSFTFLKFRSMYFANDPRIHQEYVKQFIAGKASSEPAQASSPAVYKLTKDPRITRIGQILRRTSLDELPQFFNVLKGNMSLVGPRPPVMYEFQSYDIWHKNRLLAVKPGITGLWQVEGRSRVTFDEMVRLDLKYAQSWSVWLDLKILLQTPRAVISGSGAC